MARPSTIANHPKRKEIEKAIIERRSFRDIALQYDVGFMSVIRYHDGPMAARLAKIVAKREEADGNRILTWVEEVIEKVRKMLNACDEYLSDPDDPKKYNLHARAEEVIVTVQKEYQKGEVPPPKIKISLGEAMEQLAEKGFITHSLKYGHADPRNLILQAAKTLEGQMGLLVNMSAELRAQRQADITLHPEYQKLEAELVDILRNYPEAMAEVQRAFASRQSS